MSDCASSGPCDGERCLLCPHHCRIARAGDVGRCGARARGTDGRVTSLSYGQATALALDPIEKKPLVRFHPGSTVLSYGSWGCNLSCPFCQNASISLEFDDARRQAVALAPDWLAWRAARMADNGCIGVALTYNEPCIAYEFALDVADACHARGLAFVLVTNGYCESAPWERLMQAADAANIDLKGFEPAYYRALGAPDGLDVIKRSITIAAGLTHVEASTLVVPPATGATCGQADGGLPTNDDPGQIDALAAWLASVDPGIALHLLRFWPRHRLGDRPPTSPDDLRHLAHIASRHLHHVYAP